MKQQELSQSFGQPWAEIVLTFQVVLWSSPPPSFLSYYFKVKRPLSFSNQVLVWLFFQKLRRQSGLSKVTTSTSRDNEEKCLSCLSFRLRASAIVVKHASKTFSKKNQVSCLFELARSASEISLGEGSDFHTKFEANKHIFNHLLKDSDSVLMSF